MLVTEDAHYWSSTVPQQCAAYGNSQSIDMIGKGRTKWSLDGDWARAEKPRPGSTKEKAEPAAKGRRGGRHACVLGVGSKAALAADRTSSGVGLASGSPRAAAYLFWVKQ